MDNIRHLLSHSIVYSFLKKYARFAFRIFYSDIQVKGIENIPANSPVIFAPNHQNALMDALAIIVHIKKQPVFMARADIFKGNLIKKLLHLFKIIPVFRIRDGVESLAQNDTSFAIAVQCLVSGTSFGIMPEGTDGDKHRLRPLKKGISRVAFQAQSEITSNSPVKIIPVGINYSHYQQFRSKISINFGKPIDINHFIDQYHTNPQKAFADVRDVIAYELKKLMLHINTEEHYQLILDIKNIAWYELSGNPYPNYAERFASEKQITDTLVDVFSQIPEKADELKPMVTEYHNLLKRHKLCSEIFEGLYPKEEFIWDIIRYTLVFPIILAGALFNIIPALATRYFSNKIEDSQFVSSFKFVLSLIAFPAYYLIFLCIPFPLIAKLICIITMPILGILAYDYFAGLKIFVATVRFRKGLSQNEPSISRLQYIRNGILAKVREILG